MTLAILSDSGTLPVLNERLNIKTSGSKSLSNTHFKSLAPILSGPGALLTRNVNANNRNNVSPLTQGLRYRAACEDFLGVFL